MLIFSNSAFAAESNNGPTKMTFTISLFPATTIPIKVDYTTKDITAIAGTDYVAASGTLTFPPGSVSATVDVTILANPEAMENKCLYFNLSNPVGATIATPSLAGVITEPKP
jgi:Calx-beta domain